MDFLLDHLADANLDFLLSLIGDHDGVLLVVFFHDWLAAHDSASAGLLLWNANGVLNVACAGFALRDANFLSAGALLWFADGDFVFVRLIFANDFVDCDINFLLDDFRNPDLLSAGRGLWAASRTTTSIATLDEGLNLNRAIFPVAGVLANGSLFSGRDALGHFANTLTLFRSRHHDGVFGRHVLPFRDADLVLLLASSAFLLEDRVFLCHFFGFLNQLAGSHFPDFGFRAAFCHQNFARLCDHLRNQNGSLDHARGWRAGRLRTTLISRCSTNREGEESQGRNAGPQSFLHVSLPLKQTRRLIE